MKVADSQKNVLIESVYLMTLKLQHLRLREEFKTSEHIEDGGLLLNCDVNSYHISYRIKILEYQRRNLHVHHGH